MPLNRPSPDQSGQATPFALTNLFAILPRVLISPPTGSIVDHYSRRTIMILADTGSAAQALETLTAPLLAGGLFLAIGLSGIIFIDFLTYFVGIASLRWAGSLIQLQPTSPIGLANRCSRTLLIDSSICGVTADCSDC